MKTQAEFFQAHQVDGVLTDEQMVQLLELPEGDTGLPEGSEPAAALEPANPEAVVEAAKVEPTGEPAPAIPAAEQQQVILAKDGVHTIPYERLAEARANEQSARDAAKLAQDQAESLRQQLEAVRNQPAAAATDPANPMAAAVEAGVFGDFSEEAIAKGIEKLVGVKTAAIQTDLEARFATALEPIQRQHQMSAEEMHYSSIATRHPDAEAIAESAEMAAYIAAQPTFVRPALQAVLAQGTAAEVIELMDNFKAATGRTAPNPTPSKTAAELAAAAQAVIDKAQARPPTSLTEIPAGSTAHHDEAEAMLEMSSAGLMTKFEGKSPEQIAALLAKVL